MSVPTRPSTDALTVSRRLSGVIVILCYHAISEGWPAAGAVTPRALDRQLALLRRFGYRFRTLRDALREPRPGRTVVLTFDDAFQSVLDLGLAVLARHGAVASIFVPTDFAACTAPMTWSALARWRRTPHEPELRCMGWDGLRGLASAGWEIGSHTRSHPDLRTLSDAEAAAELAGSKQACEQELQEPCTSLAYPYGSHDARIVALAGRAGYAHAVTLGTRLLDPIERSAPLAVSRQGVYRSTRAAEFVLSTAPALCRFRASARYSALASVHGAARGRRRSRGTVRA